MQQVFFACGVQTDYIATQLMKDPTFPRRIAIVHEWLTGMRGGEKCVQALCELFPDATLFTLIHAEGSVSPTIERMRIRTSFLQHVPFAVRHYRHFLPLFPTAIRQFRLDDYDLVISSHHCVAKGVTTPPNTLHICYCHTPMRYIWGLYDEYFGRGRAGLLTRTGMRIFVGYLRQRDLLTAKNPHYYIANSENVRRRIKEIYRRDADVIYPPVDTSMFNVSSLDDGYFLVVSALAPYKRVDLAVEACTKTGDKLVVVGDGPELTRLRNLAGPNVTFTGWQPDASLREFYGHCSALIFPGEEDFGIVPLEAMASGKPVIAFGRGGALETVKDSDALRTGILFPEQTVESLVAAIHRFKDTRFDPHGLRAHALPFDKNLYKQRIAAYVRQRCEEFQSSQPHERK